MNLKRIVQLVRTGEIFPYALGRFLLMRKLYSFVRGVGSPPIPLDASQPTLFTAVQGSQAVADLRRDAVAFGFQIPPDLVQEMRQYAEQTPCTQGADSRQFYFRDLQNGRLPDGTKVALARVVAPLECPAVRKVVDDPLIRQVCSQYLGYNPPNCDTRLFWSPASDLTDEQRRALSQTIDFHIDVYSFNFCYAHFYLTDCDRNSGAHELVKGSHLKKRWRWLFGGANKPRELLETLYDKSQFLLIEAPAGTGFLEDTNCYHRASPPVQAPRLLLQMRWY